MEGLTSRPSSTTKFHRHQVHFLLIVSAKFGSSCFSQRIDNVLRSRGTECFDCCRARGTDYWSGCSWVCLDGKCFCNTPRGNIWNGADLIPIFIFIRLNGCYAPCLEDLFLLCFFLSNRGYSEKRIFFSIYKGYRFLCNRVLCSSFFHNARST